jgi:hypothetical protein
MFLTGKGAEQRAVKVQEVNFAAMAKKITWWQSAESIGFSDRKSRAVLKSKKRRSHRALGNPQRARDSTFPLPRRLREMNETGPFTCYKKRTF